MKYKGVIFDLDGTILSTLDDLADSLNFALKKNKLPERRIEEVRAFVGNGIRRLIERGVPENSPVEVVDRVHKDFTEHYKIHCADKTKAYDGVLDMLERLKKQGIKLSVLSNKADYAVVDLCKKYFDGLFDAVAGEKTGIPKKPAPDGVYAIAGQMGVDIKDCVYIGDSEVDIVTANNSGLPCISVDWGFRDRQVLVDAGAKIIVSTTNDLFNEIVK